MRIDIAVTPLFPLNITSGGVCGVERPDQHQKTKRRHSRWPRTRLLVRCHHTTVSSHWSETKGATAIMSKKKSEQTHHIKRKIEHSHRRLAHSSRDLRSLAKRHIISRARTLNFSALHTHDQTTDAVGDSSLKPTNAPIIAVVAEKAISLRRLETIRRSRQWRRLRRW